MAGCSIPRWCLLDAQHRSATSQQRACPTPTATGAAPTPGQAGMPAGTKLVGRFTNRLGRNNAYAVIPKGLSDAQLIALVEQLRKVDAGSQWFLFDDESRMAEVLAALPKVEQGDAAAMPVAWVKGHQGAILLTTGKMYRLQRGTDMSGEGLAKWPA
ncbi:hypothetical protein HJ590_06750 [Naumannella sp. ID2617S]|nr:hypothetical protein [Naumannella sp. ID2617S]